MAIVGRNLISLARRLLLLPILIISGGVQAAIDSAQLTDMLEDFRDTKGAFPYSGAFGAVTVFGCQDPKSRTQLLRELSATRVSSRVLDVEESVGRLGELAWESRYQDVPSDAHKQLFVLDLGCRGVEDLLGAANGEKMFSTPFKWLMLRPPASSVDDTRAQLARAAVLADSELILWDSESNELVAIYRAGSSGHWRDELRGSWSIASGLVIGDRNVASRRRRDLGGIQLKSCLVITHPDTINHLTDYQDRHIDSITKCNYPWVLHLVNMINATVSFATADTWGYQSPNGSWGGMIGMLQRGEIDIGGTGTFLLRERIGVIQYISLSTPTGSRFIFRRPPLSSTSNLFRLPFRSGVWLVILGLVVLLIALLYPAMRLEWLQWKDRADHVLEPRLPNLSDDLLVVVGTVSQQGFWYEPRAVSTRIIILMALLAAVILYSAYTANIVALLTSTTTSIKSLNDLLNSPLSLAAHDNVFNRYYFKSFKDPVRRAIFEERIEPRGSRRTNWLAIEDGVERMRRGYFAFHVEPGCAYKIVQESFEEDEKCGFQEIDFLNVFDPHFIVKRRSPYLEIFRVGAMRIHETGLRTRELSRLYTKKPICSSASRFLSVGITECYGAFLTLLFGLMLGSAVFAVELITNKLR